MTKTHVTTTFEDAILQQLRAIGELMAGQHRPDTWVYKGVEDFLLQHGQFWIPQPLPKKYKRRMPKQCFFNAGALVKQNPKLTYVEGYAVRGSLGIPMHHAWVVDGQSKVIDPTWDDPEDAAYFGVAFPTLRVRQMQSADNGSLLYGWNRKDDLYEKPWTL